MSYDVEFERACVLFNMAATESAIGSTLVSAVDAAACGRLVGPPTDRCNAQNLNSEEGLKGAAKAFQFAAGLFNMILDQVSLQLSVQSRTGDILPDSLRTMSAIMLAQVRRLAAQACDGGRLLVRRLADTHAAAPVQAQDCFCLRAMRTQMTPLSLAKLTALTSDMYETVHGILTSSAGAGITDKSWTYIVHAKWQYYSALASLYQATAEGADRHWGVQVARLHVALQHAEAAAHTAADKPFAKAIEAGALVERVRHALESAERDNNIAYHESVPKPAQLPAIPRAEQMVKLQLPPTLNDASIVGKDPFESMVPFTVRQALQAYEARRRAFVEELTQSMTTATEQLNSALASMSLPGALEAAVKPVGLPPGLLEHAKRVRDAGGAGALEKNFTAMVNSRQVAMSMVAECERILKEEQADDDAVRARFGQDWTRTPSAQLTASMWEELRKYRTLLEKATASDGIVKGKIDANARGIRQLSQSDDQLEASLPKSSATQDTASGGAAAALRKLLDEVTRMRLVRSNLTQNLHSLCDADTIKKTLMDSASTDGMEGVCEAHLNSYFGATKAAIEENIQQQAPLLERVRTANDAFVSGRTAGNTENPRETIINMLFAAGNSFSEITANIEEGSRFYKELCGNILAKFQTKCSDFAFARKTEKRDLLGYARGHRRAVAIVVLVLVWRVACGVLTVLVRCRDIQQTAARVEPHASAASLAHGYTYSVNAGYDRGGQPSAPPRWPPS